MWLYHFQARAAPCVPKRSLPGEQAPAGSLAENKELLLRQMFQIGQVKSAVEILDSLGDCRGRQDNWPRHRCQHWNSPHLESWFLILLPSPKSHREQVWNSFSLPWLDSTSKHCSSAQTMRIWNPCSFNPPELCLISCCCSLALTWKAWLTFYKLISKRSENQTSFLGTSFEVQSFSGELAPQILLCDF